MRASESPFESYKSKRILFFAYLALKNMHVSAICHSQFQSKATGHFRNRILKVWSDHRKIALEEKIYLEIKHWQTYFCLYVKVATVQI